MPGKNNARARVEQLAIKTGLPLYVPDGYGKPSVRLKLDGDHSEVVIPNMGSGELLKHLDTLERGYDLGFNKGMVAVAVEVQRREKAS